MLLILKGAEVELPGASQESSELRQELEEEGGGEACRRIGVVAGEIGEAGGETGEGLVEEVGTGVEGEVGNWMPSSLFWDKCNVGLILCS